MMNMEKYTNFLLGSLLALTTLTVSAASLKSIDKIEIQKNLLQKTIKSVDISRLDGKLKDDFNAIYMDRKGKIFGKMGYKHRYLPLTDTGKYRITPSGTIYITWDHWHRSKPVCLHLFDTKNAYISVDCDAHYRGTFLKNKIKSGKHFENA